MKTCEIQTDVALVASLPVQLKKARWSGLQGQQPLQRRFPSEFIFLVSTNESETFKR